VQVDFDTPGARRAVSLAAVAGLHILVIALLMSQSASFRAALPIITRTRLLPEPAPRPPPPPAITPRLAPPAMFVPLPSIAVAAPPERPAAPRAVAPGRGAVRPGWPRPVCISAPRLAASAPASTSMRPPAAARPAVGRWRISKPR
jgi:hypothetical protein